MCTLFPLKRKLNRLAQTSVNQTTHYARYIWSGRHVKTIQLAVFLALTYSFVMFGNVFPPRGTIAARLQAVTRRATALILQAVPKLLRFWHTFAKFLVSGTQVEEKSLISELPSFPFSISWHAVSARLKKSPRDGDISTFLSWRSARSSGQSIFSSSFVPFFAVSSSTRRDWEAPPLLPPPRHGRR